jgi:hypothetical protein
MRISKVALIIGFAISSLLFWEVAVHADPANQTTKLTFSEALQIPGQILPAGTYTFKLASENDMDLVRISSADETHVYATLRTISTERREPVGHVVVVMAEQGAGRPDALVKWFFPGSTEGHEFIYSKQEDQQLVLARKYTVESQEIAKAGD